MNAGQMPRCPQAEQSVGWALHALEPAEEDDAAAHIPACESCREMVAQTEALLAMLPFSAPTLQPPAALRARLLARISETPQQATLPLPTPLRPVPPATATPPRPHPAPAPNHRTGQAEPDPDRERTDAPHDPPAHSRRWRIALVAAAVSVALAIGALTIRTAQVDQLSGAQTSQAQQLERLVSELQRPGAKAAALFPAGGTPVAAVLVSEGEAKVVTAGLPPNDSAASTYVLWGTGWGAPRALGTFDVTAADSGPHGVGPVNETDSFTGYAISVEPGRTEPSSPSLTVASGQVRS
jgi:hypothetical protein